MLGTVLSSDKTNISRMTGGRVAHPVLISLANISMDIRNKSSNHAFLLLALLPVPKYLHPQKKIRGMLENRLFHECMDYILLPLKEAASIGVLMSDPLGQQRFCHPTLAAYIVDTPESALIAGVAGKTSSVTMASFRQFGDPFRHEPRTASTTLATIMAMEDTLDPWQLQTWEKESLKRRLNGVHRPFWRDWFLAEPSIFLTSEPLHHWHKQFWDHDIKWCINVLGGPELDFRFSVLQPHTGYRHFKEGISAIKQVTGREHRDIQRYIVSVIADAVPSRFLLAIRSLLDFRYLAQSRTVTDSIINQIDFSLKLFHDNKDSVLEIGARRGKKGPINNWEIPKLEFLQSVTQNIRYNGSAIQWSADTTEHAHIEVVKQPSSHSNNQRHEAQICRHLDRADKLLKFDIATAIHDAKIDFRASAFHTSSSPHTGHPDSDEDLPDLGDSQELNIDTTSDLLSTVTSYHSAVPSNIVNYFYQASILLHDPTALFPLRTQKCSDTVAFHLSRDPCGKRMSIDQLSTLYQIPDLQSALKEYVYRVQSVPTAERKDIHIECIGGRRHASSGTGIGEGQLPFTHLEVWDKVRLQSTAYHHPHNLLSPVSLNAAHPAEPWSYGHYDSAIFNLDPSAKWPTSGLKGKTFLNIILTQNLTTS